MSQYGRSSFKLSSSVLILAVVTIAASPAWSQISEPSAESESDNPLAEQIASINGDYAAQQAEIVALDELAAATQGEDRVGLQTAALELRLSQTGTVDQAVAAVREFEEGGGDATEYRRQLAAFLPRMSGSIESYYDVVQTSIGELQVEYTSADANARAALGQRIRRGEAALVRLLEAGVGQVERLEAFEIPSDEFRIWLSARLSERARLMFGRMTLATVQVGEAEENVAARPDDAGSKDALITARLRLDSSTQSLAQVVPLMTALELDTARYKGLLIQSTGEITTDVFAQGVAAQLLSRWLEGVRESVGANGPRVAFQILLFGLVLAIFWGLSRFVRKVTERAVEAQQLRFSRLLKRMIVSMASGLVMIVGLLIALSQLGFEVGPMVAGLGIAGFIVGFALQETLGNFAAGVMILAYRPFDVGDLIECAGGTVFGKVSSMNLVSTTVLTLDNQTRVVPNGKIWGDVITNVTAQDVRRVDLVFGISYSDDIPKAEEVLWSIVKEHPKVVDDPEPVVKVHELGDSSVNFVVRPWAARDDYWDVHWDITREVKMRFDRDGLSIPFPQTDVHFYPTQSDGKGTIDLAAPAEYGDTELSATDAPDSD